YPEQRVLSWFTDTHIASHTSYTTAEPLLPSNFSTLDFRAPPPQQMHVVVNPIRKTG
ncbi:Hypothetical predicted protein, partial [Marmota monax]